MALCLSPSNYVLSAESCSKGAKCFDIGARCCTDELTYYCIGDRLGMSWQLAVGEKCKKCEKACFGFWDPKCGTDGITYQNQCYLENAMCRKRDLKLANDGICVGPGSCKLACGDGFQLSYSGQPPPGSYALSACGENLACVPSTTNCARACPQGYYLVDGFDTSGIQYSSCGTTIWCKPLPLVPSHCTGKFCKNNGQMTYTSQSCNCECLSGYYGDDCGSRYADSCRGLSCSNGALILADSTGCKCSCSDGYAGPYCQDTANFLSCGNMVCHNGGVLTRGAAGCSCSCLQGYFGNSCNEHQQCRNKQCKNGGFVTVVDSRCECACSFGYYGEQCQFESFGEWVAIQSRFFDLCLAYGIDGNVFVEECEFGKSCQTFLVKSNYIMTWDERCLQIEGRGRIGNVALRPCTKMTNQYFIIQEPAIKTFDKLCLDVEGGIFQGGRNVVAWDCHGNENQAWQLQPTISPSRNSPCPAFLCEVDPCKVLRCQLFPQAICEPDYCMCQARFRINNKEVRCDPIRYPDVSPYYGTSLPPVVTLPANFIPAPIPQ